MTLLNYPLPNKVLHRAQIITDLAKDVGDCPTWPSSLWLSPLLLLLMLFLFKRLWRLPLRIFCKKEREKSGVRWRGIVDILLISSRHSASRL